MRMSTMVKVLAMTAALAGPWISPLTADECDSPSSGPDVIVGSLSSMTKWGTVGDITAYSVATESCNVGDAELLWVSSTNEHPVIGQNLYRLDRGRFEQIGMSWLKHGFAALALDLCCDCQNPGTSSLLGVGCSDPYSASLNGDQEGFGGGGGLGPRFEVNPFTGEFAYPYTAQGQSGNAIYKRIQVHNDDLDPALQDDPAYFVEGHYVTPDDAAWGNQGNNASYRRVVRGAFSGGGWELLVTNSTQRRQSALFAWRAADPAVTIETIKVPGDGLMYLAYKASDNGDNTWHYEYALYNMNADRAARHFRVPVTGNINVTNVDFHDIDHHSGEPYDTTDWPGIRTADAVEWSTDTFDVNADANALRWGTLYNFRFDADAAPRSVTTTVGFFKPGATNTLSVKAVGPSTAPRPPLAAPYPHDRRKNRYISFDPNPANAGANLAFKVTLNALKLGSCSGNGAPCRVFDTGGPNEPADADCKACSVDGNPCIDSAVDCAANPPQTCTLTGEACVNNQAGSVGMTWWVGPEDPNKLNDVHLMVSESFRRESTTWPAVVHVGDCEIVPIARYGIRAVEVGTSVESDELEVRTADRPTAGVAAWWGDGVGPLESHCNGDLRDPACVSTADCAGAPCTEVWGLPDAAMNFDDITASVFLFQATPGSAAPDVTWVDLHGNDTGTPGSEAFDPPNYVANFSDIQFMIQAFQGLPYPFADPGDCPDAAAWP